MKSATRKDVAELAGVSVATVSYVVNNTKKIRPEVKKRVEEAIKKLDYHPNIIARSLTTKVSNHVALFVNNLENPYYSQILSGVQSLASEHGYIASIVLFDYSNKDVVIDIASRKIDGVILLSYSSKEDVRERIKDKFCAVDTQPIDYKDAEYDLVKSLKDKGHTKIAFLSGLKLNSGYRDERLPLFYEAMDYYKLKVDKDLIIDGNDEETTDEVAGSEAVRRLLATGKDFTAVVCINDLMAIGAIGELHRNGLKVPEDVSVIGCDNIKSASYYIPSLASIDVKAFETGRLIMTQLLAKMRSEEYSEQTVKASFVPRESLGFAKR